MDRRGTRGTEVHQRTTHHQGAPSVAGEAAVPHGVAPLLGHARERSVPGRIRLGRALGALRFAWFRSHVRLGWPAHRRFRREVTAACTLATKGRVGPGGPPATRGRGWETHSSDVCARVQRMRWTTSTAWHVSSQRMSAHRSLPNQSNPDVPGFDPGSDPSRIPMNRTDVSGLTQPPFGRGGPTGPGVS